MNPDSGNNTKAVTRFLRGKLESRRGYAMLLELEIDTLVYRLYNLTDNEIAIVENKTAE
jgi:hypothetical protein